MMRRPFEFLLIAVLFATPQIASAQVVCSVASAPVSRGTAGGHVERLGDILFNCVQNGPSPSMTAEIIVQYNLPITNSATYPAANPIAINHVSGVLFNTPPFINWIDYGSGRVEITFPAMNGGLNTFTTFGITGVLASLANVTTTSPLSAAVSVGPGHNLLIASGQNLPVVMNSAAPGLKSPRLSGASGPAGLTTTGAVAKPAWSVDIDENYVDAFRAASQLNGGFASNGTRLLVALTGIPSGVTIGDCTVAATADGSASPGTPFFVAGVSTFTAGANTVTIDWSSNPDLEAIERLTFSCGSITVGPAAATPFTPGNIALTATMAPVGAAFGPQGQVLTSPASGQIPRYASNPSPPVTVITIAPGVLSIHKNQLISSDE